MVALTESKPAEFHISQSPSKPASVGCLNLLSVDFELDPSFTTLKIFSSIPEPCVCIPVLSLLSGLTTGDGRMTAAWAARCPQQPALPCSGPFWMGPVHCDPCALQYAQHSPGLEKNMFPALPTRTWFSSCSHCVLCWVSFWGSRATGVLGVGRAVAWEDEAEEH